MTKVEHVIDMDHVKDIFWQYKGYYCLNSKIGTQTHTNTSPAFRRGIIIWAMITLQSNSAHCTHTPNIQALYEDKDSKDLTWQLYASRLLGQNLAKPILIEDTHRFHRWAVGNIHQPLHKSPIMGKFTPSWPFSKKEVHTDPQELANFEEL